LFKHRLSYLIYHRAFAGIPNDVQRKIQIQIQAALVSRKVDEPLTKHMPLNERDAILSILSETKPSFFNPEAN